ncbi:hypothetical protein [Winogradskyella sp. A3E31]|uniref:hypothetical protein n=1 Tax=Winogradskyella sp. A3E31 TaxID=3349637 RepID=UPI00398ACD15
MKVKLIFCVCLLTQLSFSQEKNELPYYEVPDYPEEFTAGTMAARMVDALGFRFYWATEGLTESDLAYKPNDGSRTTRETIDHILGLSNIIVNSTLKKQNSQDQEELTFEESRARILNNLKTAADILRESDDISEYNIIFGDNKIPFWNQVNGPIADAIWHCGQLAIFRRTTGNPINPKVNHFTGKIRN